MLYQGSCVAVKQCSLQTDFSLPGGSCNIEHAVQLVPALKHAYDSAHDSPASSWCSCARKVLQHLRAPEACLMACHTGFSFVTAPRVFLVSSFLDRADWRLSSNYTMHKSHAWPSVQHWQARVCNICVRLLCYHTVTLSCRCQTLL